MRCFVKVYIWVIGAILLCSMPSDGYAFQIITEVDSLKLVNELRTQDSLRQQAKVMETILLHPSKQDLPNQLMDSLLNDLLQQTSSLERWLKFSSTLQDQQPAPLLKAQREGWILLVVGCLLILLCGIRLAFPADFNIIMQAGYNDRLLSQINKEYNLYSSWPFVFLYLLFAGASGLFLYLILPAYLPDVKQAGFQKYLGITLTVFILFTLKIICTRLIGFIFDLQKIVRDYISALYISYFNAGLICLVVAFIGSLTPPGGILPLSVFVWILLFGFLTYRIGKTILHLLQTHKLSVFYLFVYLCVLEIAPILILINVLTNN